MFKRQWASECVVKTLQRFRTLPCSMRVGNGQRCAQSPFEDSQVDLQWSFICRIFIKKHLITFCFVLFYFVLLTVFFFSPPLTEGSFSLWTRCVHLTWSSKCCLGHKEFSNWQCNLLYAHIHSLFRRVYSVEVDNVTCNFQATQKLLNY